ncbi:MAG: TonB-dependent receptor, partial [Alistipes sp.]|nr:TonB-dependent receptor [Alistipes sp.]
MNDNGFPGGGGRGGRGGGNGMNQSSMGGFTMARNFGEEVKKNKTRYSLGGNVRFSHRNSDSQSQTASETFLTQGSANSFSNSQSKSLNKNLTLNADMRFEWNPDSMTNIVFRPGVSHSNSANSSENLSATFNKDPYEVLDERFADEDYGPLDEEWEDSSRINLSNRQSI